MRKITDHLGVHYATINRAIDLVLLCPVWLLFILIHFLYLGSSDLLPQAHEKNHPMVSIAFTLLGFLLIFVITGLLGV
jgi:zinc transporter ZupT